VSREDAPLVVDLVRDCDLVDVGRRVYTEEMLDWDWGQPSLDLERDGWLVFAASDVPVGYGWVLDRGNDAPMTGFAVVHPDQRGRGIGDLLVRLREERALERGASAASMGIVTLQSDVAASDRAAHELLEGHGYRVVRHFWEMSRPLDEPVPELPAPRMVRIRPFTAGDERSMHATLTEAFADSWGFVALPFEKWVKLNLESSIFRPDLSFLALEGEEVVGAARCGLISSEGWVWTLGVRKRWRGSGVGRALLIHAFRELRKGGAALVRLSVDSANETGATRLYESVGMVVDVQYDHFQKELAPR
jgi:mycothiol synthase